MSDELRTYFQEVIPSNPFPGQPQLAVLPTPSNPSGVFTQPEAQNKVFPVKRTSVELLSTALNTRSRKILEEFQLQQSGGLKIGDFQEGLSGDVKITPNGLVGRNIAGLTTFALDTDGNLILVGEMRSGSVMSGEITIIESLLNMDEGSDIILNSTSGDQASILFTQVDNPSLADGVIRIYYNSTTNELIIEKPTGSSQDVGLRFGQNVTPLQSVQISSQDGLLTRAYSSNLTDYFEVDITPSGIFGYTNGVAKFKIDTSGELYITGTIHQNWIP